ncbi:hypothetical protein IMY05_011G0072100 [Salix suchowensis]|nr:hypothetical protein IMY05_011G0072100 [Salix suchowensis]
MLYADTRSVKAVFIKQQRPLTFYFTTTISLSLSLYLSLSIFRYLLFCIIPPLVKFQLIIDYFHDHKQG